MLAFLIDIIFPKRCIGCKKFGTYLCANCLANIKIFEEFVCPMCLKRSITGQTHPGCIKPFGLDGLISSVIYRGVVKHLIYCFKYSPYMKSLSPTIGKLFAEMLRQNELFNRLLPQHPIVVAVPLSTGRLKKRGYNQAELLGVELAKEFGLKLNINILKRIKNTKPQFKLNKEERTRNVKDAFLFDRKYKNIINNSIVFLVDDLATSCSTLKECSKILKRAGVKKVYGVTFAREL